MKVISFTGKSGTGKSYQATALAQSRNIDAIIDDGLLIYQGKIVAGTSAKKSHSKVGAMRAALFDSDEHKKEVTNAIIKYHPDKLMIIGTSDRMTDIIADALGIHRADERIYIEDVTSDKEREMAAYYRNKQGEHVIPAPVGQLRRDFAGYFMNPLKYIRDFALRTNVDAFQLRNDDEDSGDRTVVRPRFSYFGAFTINEKAIRDIIDIVAKEYNENMIVLDRFGNGKQDNMSLTVDIRIIIDSKTIETCVEFQRDIHDTIIEMTSFTVDTVNVRISDIADDYQDLHYRKLH